jgi:CO dehydrogenase/acetyl-CoA synthase gamma subunit (corrinoid Fe-S protein)
VTSANLYIDEINFLKYLNKNGCIQCGFSSCEEFINAIIKGIKKPHDCPLISRNKAYAFEVIQKIKDLWPDVPLLMHPRPALTGLVELNTPDSGSLVLISGNNEFTEQILLTVLSTTVCPFFIIFVDTDGNTVDMAMVYQTLTAERVKKALQDTKIEAKVKRRELIIPGLSSSIKDGIEKLTGWNVRVGPKCAAELPLFMSEIWIPP